MFKTMPALVALLLPVCRPQRPLPTMPVKVWQDSFLCSLVLVFLFLAALGLCIDALPTISPSNAHTQAESRFSRSTCSSAYFYP